MDGEDSLSVGVEMRGWLAIVKCVVTTLLVFGPVTTAWAASDGKGAKDGKDKKGAAKATDSSEDDFPMEQETPAVRKEFSRAEVQRVCQRYEGALIAYYGDVYRVEHCKRRPLMDNKTVYTLQRTGKKVEDVDGNTIAALPEGEPVDEAQSLSSARSCKKLEGSYITFSSADVYYVEHCKKRLFPDWASYIKHREKHGDKIGEIFSLSEVEFENIDDGPAIPSVVDDQFAKLLTGEAGVDVIPRSEACEGIDGHVVSYYSRVYRIEQCRKREIIEPDTYLIKLGFNKIKITEMTSEQWLSLPDGKPIAETAPQGAPPAKLR